MEKIIAFIGSRKDDKSNTYIILKKILEQLNRSDREAYDIEIFSAQTLNLKQCIGCGKCFVSGKCVLDEFDGMRMFRKKLKLADFIIIGSGVYLHNVSSECKNFLDRIAIWTHTFELVGKKACTFTTSASNGNNIVNGYLSKILQSMGAEVLANIGIKLYGNVPESYFDKKQAAEYASVIREALENTQNHKISSYQEQFFQEMKKTLLMSAGSFEAQVWKNRGYFKCNSLRELVERNQYENNVE